MHTPKDLSKIKLFAMDVDGTLTDGKLYIGNDGEYMKAFYAKDGQGITLLKKQGIVPAIITGRTSKIVEKRCEELGITECYQGIDRKDLILQELMKKYDLTPEEVAYIGDDWNDIGAFQTAGVTFAPADCGKQIRPYVDIILTKKTGDCPVREAADAILDALSVDFSSNL